MKICISGNSSWSILNFRKDLILELIKSNDVYIIAPDDIAKNEFEKIGCIFLNNNLDRRSLNPLYEFMTILNIRSVIKAYQFDYILTFNIKPNLYFLLAGIGLHSKIIINISGLGSALLRQNWLSYLINFIYKIVLSFPHHIFFQNNSDQELFIKKGLLRGTKHSVLAGSGINLTYFERNNQHLLISHVINISYIGRLIHDKGIIEFLESAQSFSHIKNLHFHIYGDFDDNNPTSVKISDINNFLSENIHFHGKSNDIKKVLSSSHCIVLPSYREGMSRSLLEGAASGLPLIATNVPGCKEIIVDNKTGYLVQPKNVASLIKAVEKYLNLSSEQRLIMGNLSRKHVEENFNVTMVIAAYMEKIY